MYNWVNKHFKLGFKSPVLERDFKPLSRQEHSVWNDQHKKPSGDQVGDVHERALLKWMTEDADKAMAALTPKNAGDVDEFKKVIGGAMSVLIGRGLPNAKGIEYELANKQEKKGYLEMSALLTLTKQKEQLPTLYLYPNEWNGQVVIWISRDGKAGLLDDAGKPIGPVQKLLDAGVSVTSLDLVYQGEFLKDGKTPEYQRLVNKGEKSAWKNYAGYTYGYNYPLFAKRVHDILTMISFVRGYKNPPKRISLIGLEGAGHWVAAARAMAGDVVDRAVVDTAGFRFANLKRFDHVDFLPGGAKYLDLPGLLALSAPGKLLVAGENKDGLKVTQSVYKAAGAADALKVFDGGKDKFAEAAVKWVME